MNTPSWLEVADKFPFKLSVVMEELGQDFEEGLKVAKNLGIRHAEFHQLWGESVADASFDTRARAKGLFEIHEIQPYMITPTTFKSVLLGNVSLANIETDPSFVREMEMLRRSIDVAKFFGVSMIRVFSFRRDSMAGLGNPSPRVPKGGEFSDEMQAKVTRGLQFACSAAEDAGITLVLENVRSCWANSGHNLGLILRRVDSPLFKAIWDPANAYVCGEDDYFPTGYEAVKPYMASFHIKDAVVEDNKTGLTRWERIGDGDLRYLEQLRELKEVGFNGNISIETHWSPPGGDPISNTRRTYAGLMDILAQI